MFWLFLIVFLETQWLCECLFLGSSWCFCFVWETPWVLHNNTHKRTSRHTRQTDQTTGPDQTRSDRARALSWFHVHVIPVSYMRTPHNWFASAIWLTHSQTCFDPLAQCRPIMADRGECLCVSVCQKMPLFYLCWNRWSTIGFRMKNNQIGACPGNRCLVPNPKIIRRRRRKTKKQSKKTKEQKNEQQKQKNK